MIGNASYILLGRLAQPVRRWHGDAGIKGWRPARAEDDSSSYKSLTTVACRVIEVPGGRELYAERADDPVIPASNLKISVSAAALDRFGPNHRLKTYLAVDGDDLTSR